jgi:PAS domain-containing protein
MRSFLSLNYLDVMSPEPTSSIVPDEDKTREQLLSELQELKAQVAILREAEVKSKGVAEALRESEGRRKVAEAVEAERRRLFNVLETLPAMICLLTPDYHVAFANRSFREKFGESHGRHCYEYCFGRAEPCEFCEAYNVLITGQPHHWEVTTLDGSVVEAFDFPFTDVDGSPMILEMDIDVTERKRAEEMLRKSEARLVEAQRLAKVGDWEWDIARDEVVRSKEMYDILDVSPELSAPVHRERPSLFTTESLACLDGAIKKALEAGEPYELELELVRTDGSHRWVNARGEAVRDSSGRVIKLRGTAHDITERNRAEEELKDAKQQAELYLDLMGHDINNMNQIAIGFLRSPWGLII